MNGIPEKPLSAPNKALGFKYFYNLVGRSPAAIRWNEHPLIIELADPVPVNILVFPAAGHDVDCETPAMIAPKRSIGYLAPVIPFYRLNVIQKLPYFLIPGRKFVDARFYDSEPGENSPVRGNTLSEIVFPDDIRFNTAAGCAVIQKIIQGDVIRFGVAPANFEDTGVQLFQQVG